MINLPPYPNEPANDWKGLTLHQMRVQRAVVQARMEIEKFKISAHIDSYRNRTPLLRGRNSLLSRIASTISLAEYGYFAIRAVRMIVPLLRRGK